MPSFACQVSASSNLSFLYRDIAGVFSFAVRTITSLTFAVGNTCETKAAAMPCLKNAGYRLPPMVYKFDTVVGHADNGSVYEHQVLGYPSYPQEDSL